MNVCYGEYRTGRSLAIVILVEPSIEYDHHLKDNEVSLRDIQEVKLHIYPIILLGLSNNSSISLLGSLSSLSD